MCTAESISKNESRMTTRTTSFRQRQKTKGGKQIRQKFVRQYVEVGAGIVDDSLKPIRPVYVTICKMVCLINVVDHQIDEHSK